MPSVPFDRTLLAGFAFACRPGCGLCCYTTPAVGPDEVGPLRTIAPDVHLEPADAGFRFVPSRPNGGACALLEATRCRAHAVRPFPCRTYPLTVYLGATPQVALVLACPGIDLGPLATFPPREEATASTLGLDAELRAVEVEIDRPAGRRRARQSRGAVDRAVRALRAEGRWMEVDRSGPSLVDRALRSIGSRRPAVRPPSAAEGVESLPLTFETGLGVVALAGGPGGWTLLPLDEAKGAGPPRGVYPDPTGRPVGEPEADRLLRGYLHYVLQRDSFLGHAILRLLEGVEGVLDDMLVEELAEVGAQVVTRAAILEAARGQPAGRLDVGAIRAGIRATDAEVLDRPHVGGVL